MCLKQVINGLNLFYKKEWATIPLNWCKRLTDSFCKDLIAISFAKGGTTSDKVNIAPGWLG